MLLSALALCLGYLCVQTCAAQAKLEGDWSGGLDSGTQWLPIEIHFKTEKDMVSGSIDVPQFNQTNQPLSQIKVEGSRVHFEWARTVGTGIFDGEFRDGGLVGNYKRGEVQSTFLLARLIKLEPQILERYEGSYKLAADRFVDIGMFGDSRLYFVDSKTDRAAALNSQTETQFIAGQSADIPIPIGVQVIFVKNKRGDVTGLKWTEPGLRPINAKKVSQYKREQVTFRNGDATLVGELLTPVTKGPHPVIVFGGQGYFLSSMQGFYKYFFIRQGLAVLTLSSRSVNGEKVNYTRTSFHERAKDLLAGVQLLKSRADINPKQIGFLGDSQTAWITPLAATMSPDVAFLILRVPSALPQFENILFEVENDLRKARFSDGEVTQAKELRRRLNNAILTNTDWETLKADLEKVKNERWFGYARVGWLLTMLVPPDEKTAKELLGTYDYTPEPVLERVKVPVLAMNGELDEAVPTKMSVPILERALRKAGNQDVTIVVFPKAGHNFFETDTPYGSEFARKKKYVPEFWNTMARWIKKHLDVKK